MRNSFIGSMRMVKDAAENDANVHKIRQVKKLSCMSQVIRAEPAFLVQQVVTVTMAMIKSVRIPNAAEVENHLKKNRMRDVALVSVFSVEASTVCWRHFALICLVKNQR